MKRAATYRRVSTLEQADTNHSLEAQAGLLSAYAEQQGFMLARDYVDAGHSGTTRDRPGLTQLITDAREGLFDVLLIYRLDRLARTPYISYSIIHDLTEAGVDIVSYSEPQVNTTTPMGRASLGLLNVFSEMERDTFLQRSRDGMRKAVEKGQYPGGIVSYGYVIENKRLVIHEQEAEVVRLVFSWCVERGWSNIQIANELTRLGIPTRYQRDQRGIRGVAVAPHWRSGGVLRLLKNTTYKGEYRYGKRNGRKGTQDGAVTITPAPVIIPPDVWEAAQGVLARNRLTAMRNARNVYMLKSLIKCGHCGSTYAGSRAQQGWNGYKCIGKTFKGGPPKSLGERCTNRNLAARDVEPHIWERITGILSDPQHHLDAQPLILKPAELPHAEKALAQARTARERLMDLYLNGDTGLSKHDYLTRAGKLDGQISDLTRRVAELTDEQAQAKEAQAHAAHLHHLAALYRDTLQNADDTTRQALAHEFIRRITVQKDGSVDIEWKY